MVKVKSRLTVATKGEVTKIMEKPKMPVFTGIEEGKTLSATAEIPEKINDVGQKKTYLRGKFLGKGGFARCYEVNELSSNQTYACKIVNKTLLQKPHQREKMAQEISIHRDLKHEFIVGFHSYFEDEQFVYIVLELCAKKSLMELQKRRKTITETEARYFMHQVLMSVNYLHEQNIIHRDLKLGNIFINDDIHLKLGDFGLATTIEFDGERKRTLCGTPNYIAPEVLSKKGHSYEVDVWSIGCILYTLLVGRPPFETQTLKDTYSKIRRAEYFIPANRISLPAKLLIQKMLQVDPTARPSAKQILNSEFMTKFYIPLCLPASCLTMAPRFQHRASFSAAAPATALTPKRPLIEHNPRSPVSSSCSGNAIGTGKGVEIPKDIKSPTPGLMWSLQKQLKELLDSNPVRKKPLNDDDAEDPNAAPLLWISKWVDYSDKYGFGYQLSDDSIGVSFNDMSRMVLLPDGNHFQYIERSGAEYHYTKAYYALDLQKKVKLMNYFQQYMHENLVKAGDRPMEAETAEATRLPNMWTWFRTSRAVVMVLSNGTLQINNFQDHQKIILCPLMGAITVLEHHKPMRTYKLSLLKVSGCTEDMYNRLIYAMEKLEVIVGSVKCKEQHSPLKKSS